MDGDTQKLFTNAPSNLPNHEVLAQQAVKVIVLTIARIERLDYQLNDIKPGNVLYRENLDGTYTFKLCDFDPIRLKISEPLDYTYTPFFAAPEMWGSREKKMMSMLNINLFFQCFKK